MLFTVLVTFHIIQVFLNGGYYRISNIDLTSSYSYNGVGDSRIQ